MFVIIIITIIVWKLLAVKYQKIGEKYTFILISLITTFSSFYFNSQVKFDLVIFFEHYFYIEMIKLYKTKINNSMIMNNDNVNHNTMMMMIKKEKKIKIENTPLTFSNN